MTDVAIFHNILWSKYKGAVFSSLHRLVDSSEFDVQFVQIAETEGARKGLAGVDMSYHTYPHLLLFKDAYESQGTWRIALKLLSVLRRRKNSLVIIPGYDRTEYWVMLLYCFLTGTRRAVFCDSTAYDRPRVWYKQLAKRLFFALCDGFLAYGERAFAYLEGLGAPPSKIFGRCQAAALPKDYSRARAYSSRILVTRDKTKPEYLYVGRLSPEKGLDVLIRAFASVVSKLPEARLTIVGSGPSRPELERWISDAGVGGRVRLAGSMSIEQIGKLYTEATSLILPSSSEPWGLVSNEALSFGCPVIASHACGCVPELIKSGVTGYEFTTGDEVELAQRMLEITDLVSSGDDARVEARIALMDAFTPDASARQIYAAIRAITGRN